MKSNKTEIGFMLVLAILLPVAALVVFAWIAQGVPRQDSIQFDAVVTSAVHRFASPRFTEAMRFYSFLGSAEIMTLMTVLAVGC